MKEIFVKNAHWVTTKKIVDGYDGILTVANESENIPFQIKRVYYIYNLINHKKVQRGLHAHRTLQQVMFCVNGECNVIVDDGVQQQKVVLDEPNKGIYLGTYLWHVMDEFKNNCILLVFASDLYDESDYIRNYDEFLEVAANQKKIIHHSFAKTGSDY
jgi:dTDP-4-dehydrorhamnose 3,5-epimerase-like enzyme